MKTNTEKLIELVQSGAVTRQSEAAKILGISRERVRQIAKTQNLKLNQITPNPLIDVPCPVCGKTNKVKLKDKLRGYRKGYCLGCRSKKEFCLRGHPKDPNNPGEQCQPCMRRIVEVRTCVECKKPLRISYRQLQQIKYGNSAGLRHRSCYIESLRGKTGSRLRIVEVRMSDEYIPLDSIPHRTLPRWPFEKWANIPPGLALEVEPLEGKTPQETANSIRSSIKGKNAQKILRGKRLLVLLYKDHIYVGAPKEE